ncbi:EF-hand domain-containing protein [Naegleria gruberi]|uniref:EF-hand domain-containing protein n=1 Tax=Naegleria gruberi TaxID=5762 RepID=D2V7Y1_NAEGR|nr:EF-hand domain-containing protein [Naegleria gruberi]EFC46943.1 EF-hand domain-containing protein [Naegleria gruberi]|eukprot:XP_002679687.1 EF-hand domain-containing protein [Naegleria gruberi strain NEG-M]
MNQSPNHLLQHFNDLDAEFHQADKDRDNILIPPEAKVYFDQFALPLPVMKFIWGSSKTTPAPGLTLDEFKHAMQMIRQELMNPGSLPINQGGPNFQPPQQQGFDYSIRSEDRDTYETNFSNLARGKYTISYDECMNFFSKAGLPNDIVNTIFQLADFEKNRVLDKEEFVIAMHLLRLKRKMPNMPIPNQLPPVLIPPSKANVTPTSLSASPSLRPRSESTTSMDSINAPPTLVSSSGTLGFNNMSGGLTPLNNFGNNMMMGGPPPLNNFGGPNMMGGGSNQINVGPVRDMENQINRVLDETRMLNQQSFPLRQSVEQNDLRLNGLRERKADLENDLNQVRQEFESLKMQNQAKVEEINSLEAQCYTFEQERMEFQNQIQRVRQESMRLEQLFERAQLSFQSASGVVDALKSELEQGVNELIHHKDELFRLKNSTDQGDEQTHMIEQEINNAKNELMMVKQQLMEARQANEELQLKIRGLQVQKQDVEQTTFQTKTELSNLVSQNDDLKNQLIRVQTEFESQKQKGVPSAKLVKLASFVKQIQEYIQSFDSALQEEFPNDTPLQLKQVSPISTTVPITKASSGFGGFDNDDFGFDNKNGNKGGFGNDDFGFNVPPPVVTANTTKVPTPSSKPVTPSTGFVNTVPTVKAQSPSFEQPKTNTGFGGFDNDDFGFDNKSGNTGFDADFSFGNDFGKPATTSQPPKASSGFVNDDFGFDAKPATSQPPKANPGFGGFENDDFGFDSNNGNKGSFDTDFGFEADFNKPATTQPATTKPAATQPAQATGFDDFGFDNNTNTTSGGFDDFGFDNNATKSTSDPWSDFSASNSTITKEAAQDDWASSGW